MSLLGGTISDLKQAIETSKPPPIKIEIAEKQLLNIGVMLIITATIAFLVKATVDSFTK